MADVEVISREIIKPSRPTPPHLRLYQLSRLDQSAPPHYVSYVLFYSADEINKWMMKLNRRTISVHLKASLSDILTHYYLLAGRLKENITVVCNDEGALFLEARVDRRLSDMLRGVSQVDMAHQKFLPLSVDVHEDFLLGIQFNMFMCGGIALGICLSHKVGDGLSGVVFIKTMAQVFRGEENITLPEFVAAKLFPPKGSKPLLGVRPASMFDNVISKCFVFGPHAVETLRTKYGAGTDTSKCRRPTKFEALEAFILSRFMAATGVYARNKSGCCMYQSVNLRAILEPRLPAHFFGNMVGLAFAYFPHDTSGSLCSDLVQGFRSAISEINKEQVMKQVGRFSQLLKMSSSGDLALFGFTSLPGHTFSECDFGWGAPSFVGMAGRMVGNFAALTNLPDGGVEACITLRKQDMPMFEKDEEIKAYVLHDKMSRF